MAAFVRGGHFSLYLIGGRHSHKMYQIEIMVLTHLLMLISEPSSDRAGMVKYIPDPLRPLHSIHTFPPSIAISFLVRVMFIAEIVSLYCVSESF
jgi:hypothetical protein